MRQNVFAYTGPGPAPEYISVNVNSDRTLEITVRSIGGGLATIDLTREQIHELAEALQSYDILETAAAARKA